MCNAVVTPDGKRSLCDNISCVGVVNKEEHVFTPEKMRTITNITESGSYFGF